MKYLVFSIMLLLVACDNRFDGILDKNAPPTITYGSKRGVSIDVRDSVKLSLKSKKRSVLLEFQLEDSNLKYVEVTTTMAVAINEKVTNKVELEDSQVQVELSNMKLGINSAVIYGADALNKRCEMQVVVIGYDNLIPKAVFTMRIGSNEYELHLDGSSSFDQDRKHGGKIVAYKWTINNTTFPVQEESIFTRILPSQGEYIIKLQVLDNDGVFSQQATNIFRID